MSNVTTGGAHPIYLRHSQERSFDPTYFGETGRDTTWTLKVWGREFDLEKFVGRLLGTSSATSSGAAECSGHGVSVEFCDSQGLVCERRTSKKCCAWSAAQANEANLNITEHPLPNIAMKACNTAGFPKEALPVRLKHHLLFDGTELTEVLTELTRTDGPTTVFDDQVYVVPLDVNGSSRHGVIPTNISGASTIGFWSPNGRDFSSDSATSLSRVSVHNLYAASSDDGGSGSSALIFIALGVVGGAALLYKLVDWCRSKPTSSDRSSRDRSQQYVQRGAQPDDAPSSDSGTPVFEQLSTFLPQPRGSAKVVPLDMPEAPLPPAPPSDETRRGA